MFRQTSVISLLINVLKAVLTVSQKNLQLKNVYSIDKILKILQQSIVYLKTYFYLCSEIKFLLNRSMNLSNTAQYAIRSISYMALKKNELYSATDLVKELKIPDKYLKRILTTLSNNDIIKSVQGRYGGFALHKDLEKISLLDIVKAVDNIDKYFGCILGFEECSDENPCALHTKWAPVRNELLEFLENTTMADVIKNPQIVKH